MFDGLVFEWDENKNLENIRKHGVSFEEAREVFFDIGNVIHNDDEHSCDEKRFFCITRCKNDILTVRFTVREGRTRIIGAGFWRKGRRIYEKESCLY